MKVVVKYFASIREAAGTASEVVELPRSGMTVDALRDELARRNGRLTDALSRRRVVRSAVDTQIREGSYALRDGCEVAFFPPVTGG